MYIDYNCIHVYIGMHVRKKTIELVYCASIAF